jgi:hypothetical protein
VSAEKKDPWGCHCTVHLCLIGLLDARCEFGKSWQIEKRGKSNRGED